MEAIDEEPLRLPPGARQVLLAPGTLARALAVADDDPERRWMLRLPRDIRRSFVAEVIDRGGDRRDQERWLLSQDDAICRSFADEVLAARPAGDPAGGLAAAPARGGPGVVRRRGAGHVIAAALVAVAATTGAQDAAAVEARARAAGLGRHARAIADASRPAVRIDRTLMPTPAARGTSRLGGSPDLPRGTRWPMCKRQPMAFLGQLDLADIPADVRGGLPSRGLLSFFLHVEEEEPGIGADEGFWLWGGDCGRAILTSSRTPLIRRTAPRRNPRMVLRPAKAILRRQMTVPDLDAVDMDRLTPPLRRIRLNRRDQDRYIAFRDRLSRVSGDGTVHRFGGYGDTLQLDPRRACGGPRDQWRLLLQFEWDERLGFEVADGGNGWLYARAADLARGRTGRVCSTLDSN